MWCVTRQYFCKLPLLRQRSAFLQILPSCATNTQTIAEPTGFSVISKTKTRASGHTTRSFINLKEVAVEGGSGGDGCIAFSQLFCNPNDGPSGGDGGNGGHVLFEAHENVVDLSHLPGWCRADAGIPGHGSNCHGADAKHLVLKVPVGTEVFLSLPEGVQKGEKVVDISEGVLLHPGAVYVAARGGVGGKGNAFLTQSKITNFTTSSDKSRNRNQPLRIAERGASGEKRRLRLRMSRLAQLGFVGAPNAGKSTLLRCLTRARPRVAPHPFTTLKPHVGVMLGGTVDCNQSHNSNEEPITIADLPGLIEGAAEYNAGLGVEFLSLVADCKLLAYVVDVGTAWASLTSTLLCTANLSDLDVPCDEVTRQLQMLHHELTMFDPVLTSGHKNLVLGTKIDLVLPKEEEKDALEPSRREQLINILTQRLTACAIQAGVLDPLQCDSVLLVSAKRGDNVPQLARYVREHVSFTSNR